MHVFFACMTVYYLCTVLQRALLVKDNVPIYNINTTLKHV